MSYIIELFSAAFMQNALVTKNLSCKRLESCQKKKKLLKDCYMKLRVHVGDIVHVEHQDNVLHLAPACQVVEGCVVEAVSSEEAVVEVEAEERDALLSPGNSWTISWTPTCPKPRDIWTQSWTPTWPKLTQRAWSDLHMHALFGISSVRHIVTGLFFPPLNVQFNKTAIYTELSTK